jgi:hypothetical protein
VRLLDTLRGGGLMLTPQERADAERLLGVEGVDPLARLALPAGSPQPELLRAAQAALSQWQRRAEHPASARDVREAARVLVRTSEGLLLGALPPSADPGGAPGGPPPGRPPGHPVSSPGGGPMSNRGPGGWPDRVVGCS